jgi:hypothetical protein
VFLKLALKLFGGVAGDVGHHIDHGENHISEDEGDLFASHLQEKRDAMFRNSFHWRLCWILSDAREYGVSV